MNKKLLLISVILFSVFIILISNCPTPPKETSDESDSSSSASSTSSSDSSSSSISSSDSSSSSISSSSSSLDSSSSSQQANITYNLNTTPGTEWTVGPTNCDWEWGTVSVVGPIGSICYGTNINGYYGDDRTYAENYVQLGPLNLSGFATASGFRMTFDAYFDLDFDYDRTQIQYSTNGTTFNAIDSAYVSGYPYTYTGSNEWSPNPSTDTPAWRTVTIDLGGMGLNGQTTVYFRWVLESDPYFEGIVFPGFYIDNINIGY